MDSKTVLFLGDSITDCHHCFTEDNLGDGFVKILAEQAGLQAVNGGTDGFTFPRVLQKWKQIYRNERYDCVVITGGINETAILADTNLTAGQAEDFLHRSMEALGTLLENLTEPSQTNRILLIEPFLFPIPESRRLWEPVLLHVQKEIEKTASAFPANTVTLLSVQKPLDKLAVQNGLYSVTTDGVHLTAAGHACLAGHLSKYLA